jgi:hypothetical protein
MFIVILLVSSCRGLCCRTSVFEASHPNIVIDHVRTTADAVKLIPLAKPDLIILGPDVKDETGFRRAVTSIAPETRVAVMPCNHDGPESEQCLATRADFMARVTPFLRAS